MDIEWLRIKGNFMQTMSPFYSLLTPSPWYPGWGLLFQSNEPREWIVSVPGPLVIVTMNHDTAANANWVRHPQIVSDLLVGISDDEHGVLPDEQLLAIVETGKCFLSKGINLLSHCLAGASRSSYYSCALTMNCLKIGFDQALAHVKTEHPQANPNPYFKAHLRSIESLLIR